MNKVLQGVVGALLASGLALLGLLLTLLLEHGGLMVITILVIPIVGYYVFKEGLKVMGWTMWIIAGLLLPLVFMFYQVSQLH